MATIFEEQTSLNTNTGEVTTESTVIKRIRNDEPDFVKLYINAWCIFKDIKGINTGFLYQLLPYMTYAHSKQLIIVNSYVKEEVARALNWSLNSYQPRFSKEISKLKKNNVFKEVGIGTYQVNPELIGKGDWKDIRKLRATFNLENGAVTHIYETKDEQ